MKKLIDFCRMFTVQTLLSLENVYLVKTKLDCLDLCTTAQFFRSINSVNGVHGLQKARVNMNPNSVLEKKRPLPVCNWQIIRGQYLSSVT